MDIGYTFSTRQRLVATVYAPPGVVPPDEITMTVEGRPELFMRLSDRSLVCGDVVDVQGHCTSWECHRTVLGECVCGRHGIDADGNKIPVGFSVERKS